MELSQIITQMTSDLRELILYTIFKLLPLTKLIQLYLYFGQEEGSSTPIQSMIASLIRKKSSFINIPHRLPYGDLIQVFSRGDISHIKFTFKSENPIFWPFWKYDKINMKHVTIKDTMDPIIINEEEVDHLVMEDISSFDAFTGYLEKFTNLKSLMIKCSEFDFTDGKFIKAKLEKLKIKQNWIFDSEDALLELIKIQAKTLKELYIHNRYPSDIFKSLKNVAFPKLVNLTMFFKSPAKHDEYKRINTLPNIKYLCAMVEKASDALELIYQIIKNCRLDTIIIEITAEVLIDKDILQKMAHLKAKENFTKYIHIRVSKYTYIATI